MALQLTLNAYERLPSHPKGPRNNSGYTADSIVVHGTTWIRHQRWQSRSQIRFFKQLQNWTKGKTLGSKQALSNIKFLENKLGLIFSSRPDQNQPACFRSQKLKEAIADHFLDELLSSYPTELKGHLQDWDRFADLAHRRGQFIGHKFPGLYELFAAFMAEEIKTSRRVSRVIQQSMSAEIHREVGSVKQLVESMQLGLEDTLIELQSVRLALVKAETSLTSSLRKLDSAIDAFNSACTSITPKLDSISNVLWEATKVPGLNSGYLEIDTEMVARRPTAVLVARYNVIPFVDIGGTTTEAIKWCLMEPTRVLGRLYHGAGGAGKTRMFLEICERLREMGWLTGFLEKPEAGDSYSWKDRLGSFLRLHNDKNVLVVVDYAETRLDDLLELQRIAKELVGPRIRIVGIARSGGSWWRDSAARADSIFEAHESRAFDSANFSVRDAKELWLSAAKAIAIKLADAKVIRPLTDDEEIRSRLPNVRWFQMESGKNRAPLSICLNAFLSVYPEDAELDSENPLASIALVEKGNWRRALESPNEVSLFKAECTVSTATLFQGSIFDDVSFIDRIGQPSLSAPALLLARQLSYLYPHASYAIGAIEPDLIGEHIIGRALLGLANTGREGARKGVDKDASERFIRLAWEAASDDQKTSLLIVLNRATRGEHRSGGVRDAAIKAIEDLGVLPFETPNVTAKACLAKIGSLVEVLALRLKEVSCDDLFNMIRAALVTGHPWHSKFLSALVQTVEVSCPARIGELAELQLTAAKEGEVDTPTSPKGKSYSVWKSPVRFQTVETL